MPFLGDPRPAPPWLVGAPGRWWNRGSEAIAKTLKRSRTTRRITPARRLKIAFEPFDLHTTDGVRLSAWFIPGCEEVQRSDGLTVVLLHHYGGQKATLMPWIEFFHRMGLPAICFDARGHAASDSAPRGRGSFVRRAEDVRAACDEARRRGAERILGFGQSQGAAALVISMSERDDVAGVILESGPAPDMSTAAWGLAGNMLGALDSRQVATRTLLAARIIPGTHPARYLWSLWTSLRRLRMVPLLWLHGGRDSVIAARWAGWWYRSLRPKCGLWRSIHVPSAEHVRCLQEGGDAVRDAVSELMAQLDQASCNEPGAAKSAGAP
jgi:alpha-beta hydrolase superfamily lysophospholipase